MSKRKHLTYTQCTMEKKLENGSRIETVSWIPSLFAKLNRNIELKKDDDTFDPGWKVIHVGHTRDAQFVEDRERDYLKQRSVSDI